jgi:hypothetical protein
MAECKLLKKCLFFHENLQNMPAASEMMKRMYCRWQYDECARYKIATKMGPENVPSGMFPQGRRNMQKLYLLKSTKLVVDNKDT